MNLVETLMMERNATNELPKLEGVHPISTIMKNALSLGNEIDFNGDFSCFDEPKEPSL
jgi:hypothetical protein